MKHTLQFKRTATTLLFLCVYVCLYLQLDREISNQIKLGTSRMDMDMVKKNHENGVRKHVLQ